MFINVAIVGDARVEEKQQEIITKHQNLLIEVEHLWNKVIYCYINSELKNFFGI